jgi:hypothetical protein
MTTNENLNISNNKNNIEISHFTIDGPHIFDDNDIINDDRQIDGADFIEDNRRIEHNRAFHLESQNSGSSIRPLPSSLGLNTPTIHAPPVSQYHLGGGISCSGPTLHAAAYSRGAGGFAPEFGVLVSISIPLDAGLRARCEAAHQSRLAIERVQRQIIRQQANYYRDQTQKLRSENILLDLKIRELKRKFRESEKDSS